MAGEETENNDSGCNGITSDFCKLKQKKNGNERRSDQEPGTVFPAEFQCRFLKQNAGYESKNNINQTRDPENLTGQRKRKLRMIR